jgi:hypothetical protein
MSMLYELVANSLVSPLLKKRQPLLFTPYYLASLDVRISFSCFSPIFSYTSTHFHAHGYTYLHKLLIELSMCAKQSLILNPTKLPKFQEVFKIEGFINPKTHSQNGTQGSVVIIIIKLD